MSSNTLIRCPPYCRSNCTVHHHPLLVALLNCEDSNDKQTMSVKLKALDSVVTKYKNDAWSMNGCIPDEIPAYRFTLVHWACALGQINALKWLKENSFDMTVFTNDLEKDTGLHRALCCLMETCPKDAKKKFCEMLPIMEKTLPKGNRHGNTPLHQSCIYYNENKRPEFYLDCINSILQHATNKGSEYLKIILSIRNKSAYTPLHVLCQHDRNINVIKKLISLGANITMRYTGDMTPLDVAIKSGQMKLAQMLTGMMDKEVEAEKKVQPRRGQVSCCQYLKETID